MRKWSRDKVFLVVLGSGLLLSGCAWTWPMKKQTTPANLPPRAIYVPPTEQTVPEFFACNKWEDKDKNGRISDDEWKGIKNAFRTSEDIMFVAYVTAPIGTKVACKFLSPMGEAVYQVEDDVTVYKETNIFQRGTDKVKNWIDKGGPGLWVMEWYVNGELANRTEVSLIQCRLNTSRLH